MVPLEKLLDVQNGFAFSSKQFSSEIGKPLVRIRDLKDNGQNMLRFAGTFDSAYVVKNGDLLIGMDGEFVCHQWAGGSALLNQRVCRLVNFSDDLLPRFLFYGINRFLKEIENRTTFTTVKHLSSKKIKSIQFSLPPLDEQKRIVAILDQAFAALDRARANVEANLADADEAFDHTLRATFDKLRSTAPAMSLNEAALDFSRGKSRHRPRNDPKLYGGKYPFIQTGDIRKSDGSIREYAQTYNEAGLVQSKLWPVGTVCITIAANIAETGVLEFEGCFPDSVIGMVPNPQCANAYYVEYMLRYFSENLKQQGKGSAQDNINLATFEHARFPFPALPLQMEVVRKLDKIATCVGRLRARYEKQLANLADLRQSILQRAFAGELT